MNRSEKLLYLIKYLLSEKTDYKNIAVPESTEDRFRLFRSLVNVRAPRPVSEEFLAVQDEFLRKLSAEKGVVNYKDLTPVKPRVYLWQGDITTLKCGAIVNAANSQMLGCFCPCYGCVKCSEGREHCYMYFLDKQRDKNGAEIYRTKTAFDYTLQKRRNGALKI